jgi:hypothetical protein
MMRCMADPDPGLGTSEAAPTDKKLPKAHGTQVPSARALTPLGEEGLPQAKHAAEESEGPDDPSPESGQTEPENQEAG